jgi:hypothetical protein
MDQCESAHCGGIQGQVNEICKATGWGVNHPVIVQKPDGTICYCSCSCLAFGTPVMNANGDFQAIESFHVGGSVMACGSDLSWKAVAVEYSGGTTGVSRQKYVVLIQYESTAIAVTSEHIFLLQNKTLIRADRLSVDDQLLGADGRAVAIQSIHIGDYVAGFHHIATSQEQPDANLTDHLVNCNGLVCGDYAVQLFFRDTKAGLPIEPHHASRPIIGSPEYIAKFGDACLAAPNVPNSHSVPSITGKHLLRLASKNAADIAPSTFIAANHTKLNIPPDACGFISDQEAAAKANDAMRPWNDPLSRQWTQYLLDQHKTFYPGIVFQLDWSNDTVNAYAWIQNGTRYVAILGGLVRHFALQMEGIALVIAHETAHHYGGQPTFPSGLSCEGQADYAGVRDVMRKVWFGEQYAKVALAGISQMAAFFGVPNSANVPGGSSGCQHPAGACRIATYYSAIRLSGKPNCAV